MISRKNKARVILFILLVFLFFCLISFFYIVSNSLKENITINLLFYSLGKLVGLIGFLFLSLLIISGDTARFFDRYFGMDKIIKFQRKFALITAVFILFHPIFFVLSSKLKISYLIPDFTIIPLTLGVLSLYIFIIVMICSLIYKRISYNIWQYLHILTYILFFFSLYHAANWGSDYNLLPIKIIYGVLLVFIIIGIIYRTQYKIKQRKNKFYVKEIKKETEDTFTLVLKQEKKLLFEAGQFCFLRLNKDKLYARHPFTISSSPEDEDLHFTIKLDGRFTKAASELKKDEEVIVDGPFGVFTIEGTTKNLQKDLVFLAGGVGITPFMSMIKHQLKKAQEKQNILLLYGARTYNSIIFKKDLDNIKEKWFKKVYILSQDDSYYKMCEKGYIDKSIIGQYVKNIKNSLFYICGPEPMKKLCKKELLGLGVKRENIVIEDFFW